VPGSIPSPATPRPATSPVIEAGVAVVLLIVVAIVVAEMIRCVSGPPMSVHHSCGVDCESTSRFEALLAGGPHPLPSVFTAREVAFAGSRPDPARALCASFCAKEAIAKALGGLFDFTSCELFAGAADDGAPHELELADAFRREHGITSATATVRGVDGVPGEILVVVHLYA